MSRHDVTDAEWNAIRVFLPRERNGQRGRPWVSHRMVINGILWVLHVGGSWRDLPERYGNWSTIYNRFQRWCREGLWDRMMKSLLQKLDASGGIDRSLWCIEEQSFAPIDVLLARYIHVGKPRTTRRWGDLKVGLAPSFTFSLMAVGFHWRSRQLPGRTMKLRSLRT